MAENYLDKLQKHTVELYDLGNKDYVLKKLPARDLVKVSRFDLFAKLAYIHYRDTEPERALEIYTEHIKAFNPDLKEPGREDKDGIQDFIDTFDKLIDFFEENDFDPEISLIPISEDKTILDGAHRVAALAYFDKSVSILHFKKVDPVTRFDYKYFQKRGLPSSIADQMVLESLNFTQDLFVACLWPRIGDLAGRAFARSYFEEHFEVFYIKNMSMSLENLSMFVYEIYNHQDWVGTKENNYAGARNKAMQCYGSSKIVQFVVFKADTLEEVVAAKESIRNHYQLEKHALHITDDEEETEEIFDLILTEKAAQYQAGHLQFTDRLREYKALFKNVYLVNFKVRVAGILKKMGLYK